MGFGVLPEAIGPFCGLVPISSSTTKPQNGPMASGSTPRPMPSHQRCGINSKAPRTTTTPAWSWAGGRWCRCSWVTSSCMVQQPEQAAISYKRVLEGDVDATIAALAEQGLKRCQSEDITSGAGTTPAPNGAIPDLLKDPFLNTAPDQVRPAPADVVTAMPWLSSDEELRAMPTPNPFPTQAPRQAPVPNPQPTLTPEANSQAEVQKQKPEPTAEEPPHDTIEPAPQPQEPAATKLLEHSWLRVQLQPDIKSPTDSVEPMGLIKRIKGVFARSAGR